MLRSRRPPMCNINNAAYMYRGILLEWHQKSFVFIFTRTAYAMRCNRDQDFSSIVFFIFHCCLHIQKLGAQIPFETISCCTPHENRHASRYDSNERRRRWASEHILVQRGENLFIVAGYLISSSVPQVAFWCINWVKGGLELGFERLVVLSGNFYEER